MMPQNHGGTQVELTALVDSDHAGGTVTRQSKDWNLLVHPGIPKRLVLQEVDLHRDLKLWA